ncbi:MAG TPA: bifunctional nuclease family protein [Candidatus Thermoplasmatota archaeon]|nr:bifunctional nuclease family protein [Candidatus Thermoplasmatota archaeon]
MVLVKPKDDPLDVRIERVLISQQEAVVILATENGDYHGRVLPVFVDLGQAMNIQVGLEGRRAGRPLTHDLFTSVMNELGCTVDKIVIEEIAANTFFATLHVDLDRGGKREKVSFDARPSDCLALAVRSGSPIKVRRKVLDAAAVDRDKLFGKSGEGGGKDLALEEEDAEDEEPEDKPAKKKPERIDPGEFEKP